MTAAAPWFDLFNRALPVVALSLWAAIYVVYFWHEPAVRRWVGLRLHRLTHVGRRRAPPSPVPSPFRPTAPAPSSVRPPRPMVVHANTATAAAVAPRVAEWRAQQLPLRYRLLGQVRPASNDN